MAACRAAAYNAQRHGHSARYQVSGPYPPITLRLHELPEAHRGVGEPRHGRVDEADDNLRNRAGVVCGAWRHSGEFLRHTSTRSVPDAIVLLPPDRLRMLSVPVFAELT